MLYNLTLERQIVPVAVTVRVNTASEDIAVIISDGAEGTHNLDFPFTALVPLCISEGGGRGVYPLVLVLHFTHLVNRRHVSY